jgi:hypothetical protein
LTVALPSLVGGITWTSGGALVKVCRGWVVERASGWAGRRAEGGYSAMSCGALRLAQRIPSRPSRKRAPKHSGRRTRALADLGAVGVWDAEQAVQPGPLECGRVAHLQARAAAHTSQQQELRLCGEALPPASTYCCLWRLAARNAGAVRAMWPSLRGEVKRWHCQTSTSGCAASP